MLLVASRDLRQPSYEQFMSGFRPRIEQDARIELFVEFLDTSRFPQPEQRQRMLRLLKDKYADTPIDVVVSTSPIA